MFKEFLTGKIIKSKLAGLPERERQKIAEIMTKNPELLNKIASEMQSEMKSGKDQMAAVMAVAKKYENELKGIL